MPHYHQFNLKEIRENVFGLGQKEFALAIDIAYRTYQGYESKGVPPSKLRKLQDNLAHYANSIGADYSLKEVNSTKKESLSDYHNLEIVEFISDNIEDFKSLSTFNNVVGLTRYKKKLVEMEETINDLNELIEKLKSKA